MRYILTLPNYKGSFSLSIGTKTYSIPQSASGADLDDEDWNAIKDTEEVKALQDAKLLHVLESEPEVKPKVAPTSSKTNSDK
jgi:hypothetical protein